MSVVSKVKEASKPAMKYVSGGVGVAGSAFLLQKLGGALPATWPALVRKVGPGLATMIISYLLSTKVSDERLKALTLGMGIGGAIDAIRKVIVDIPQLSMIADKLPQLSGPAGYSSVATTFPGWNYYLQNSLQGAPEAFALNGGMSMQGAGGAMQSYSLYGQQSMQGLGNDPYALT